MSTALSHLASALSPVGGAVAAIVVLTLAVRLALHPLTRAAVRGERVRARLAPRLAELRQRHGSDLVRLSQETQSLYRSEQISPFVGVLPLLVQLPMIFVLYRVFSHGDGPLAAAHLFGVPLHAHLLASLASGGALVVFGVVLAHARRHRVGQRAPQRDDRAGRRCAGRRRRHRRARPDRALLSPYLGHHPAAWRPASIS